MIGRITCSETRDLITDFLEAALPRSKHAQVVSHLLSCAACHTHLRQMLDTVRLLRRLGGEELSPDLRSQLLTTFREARQTPRARPSGGPWGLASD